jgi:phospholipid/cholesterol/gamma-HCH transport system substrate-binding protein
MKHANAVLGDPQAQDDLKQAIAAVSGLAAETRTLMTAMRSAIEKADANLENLKSVTGPLARRSNSIVTKLDGSIGHLEQLLAELNGLARMLNSEEGTFRKFVEDPELYRNLNRSAEALAILLRNLGPIMDDLAVLSDKLARHPELLGISGAVSPSTGIKTPGELDRVTPAGGVRRGGATSKARLAD